MKYKALLLIGLLAINYSWSQEPVIIEYDKPTSISEFSVSIINLISTPEKYHNKRIQVIGYLNLEFEGNAIYLHKEDYKKSIASNGFWVDFTEESWTNINNFKINKCYVLIEGTFDMDSFGHMGLWSGTIKDITRVVKWD